MHPLGGSRDRRPLGLGRRQGVLQPPIDAIQENASVFAQPGEVVIGPARPVRVKTANCFGIYYGEGKGLDAANIFARVVDADMKKLREIGDSIWKNGPDELHIEGLDD